MAGEAEVRIYTGDADLEECEEFLAAPSLENDGAKCFQLRESFIELSPGSVREIHPAGLDVGTDEEDSVTAFLHIDLIRMQDEMEVLLQIFSCLP